MFGRGKKDNSGSADDMGKTRERLAYIVLSVCAVGIIVIAGAAIWAADSGHREGITRLVFVSVLPLFGTWVGTVLAFYFAARNLEAATASTRSLTETGARLAGIATAATLVSEKMIAWEGMKVFTLTEAEANDVNTVPLSKLWDKLAEIKPLDRLPIVGPDRTIKALAHRS